MKKILLWLTGLGVLIVGLGLILRFWTDISILFKAMIGIILAVAGIVMMSIARD